MDEDEIPTTCNFLKEPLEFNNLVGKGAKFQIDCDFDEGFTNDISDELNIGSDNEDIEDVDHNALISPWTKPFAELKQQMEYINQHIHKKIIKKGNVAMGLMPLKARVCIRYNAYWELEGAPFDSSFLRGSTFHFYTGCGEVLEGLEAAVRTMYIGEHSQFVISYELLFREMGCPPRVRPHADGLFIIELVRFNAVGDLNAEQQVPEADRNNYSIIAEKVREIHLKGLDFFKQGQHKNACRAFEKAVGLLTFCRLANEEEQSEQTTTLIKLNTNLAVCYNKLNSPAKTCIIVKEIRRLTNNKPSCKALFQEGRALVLLGEYAQARQILAQAQKIEPHNTDITNEQLLLEKRYKRYKEAEKSLWSRAMGVMQKPDVETTIDDLSSKFSEEMLEVMKSFKETNEKQIALPDGMTVKEIETLTEHAKLLDLKITRTFPNEKLSLSKK